MISPVSKLNEFTFVSNLLKPTSPQDSSLKTYSTAATLKTLGKSKDHYRAANYQFTFDPDEELDFDSLLVYDNNLNRYKKKQIQVIVNLISDSRSDEAKLVGRIRLDLNDFIMGKKGKNLRREQELENCSVKKPQTAKLQFELGLLRIQTINVITSPEKDSIFGQIEKGMFANTFEYNQFCSSVFGKDYQNISINKNNKLVNQIEQNSSRLETKSQIFDKSLNDNQILKEQETFQPSDNKILQYNHELDFRTRNNKLQNNHDSLIKLQSKQTTPQKIDSQQFTIIKKQQIKASIIKNPAFSQLNKKQTNLQLFNQTENPVQNLKVLEKKSICQQANTQKLEINQQKKKYPSQSFIEEQQIVIQQLREKLEEANQIIEHYKLELQLMNDQTERLQRQKKTYANQVGSSKTINIQLKSLNQKSPESLEITAKIDELQAQILKYQKMIIQKQQIISQKDKAISDLKQSTQKVADDLKLALIQKDQLYNELHQQYHSLSQSNIQINLQMQSLKQQLNKKQQANKSLTLKIEELKNSAESRTSSLGSENPSNDQIKLNQKLKIIKQLEKSIEIERSKAFQAEQRSLNQQKLAIDLNKQLYDLKQRLRKNQEVIRKYKDEKLKTERDMHNVGEKFKQVEKQKYELSQEIARMTVRQKSNEKFFQQKVLSYKAQYESMCLSYQQAKNEIAELKNAVQSCQSNLKEQQAKNKEQIEQMKKKLDNFNKKEHMLRESLDLLESQTTKIKNFVEEKQTKLRQYQELVVLKDQQLNQKNDRINELNRKHRKAENTIQDLNLEIKLMQSSKILSRIGIKDGGQSSQLQTRLKMLTQTNIQLLQKQKMQNEIINVKQEEIHYLKKVADKVESLKLENNELSEKLQLSQQKNCQLKEQTKNLIISLQEQKHKLKRSQQLQLLEKQRSQIVSLLQEKALFFNQNQQKEQQILNFQSKQQLLKEQLSQFQKKINQKDLQLLETHRLLQQLQRNDNQIHKKIKPKDQTLNPKQKKNNPQGPTIHESILKKQINTISQLQNSSTISPNSNARTKEEEKIYKLHEEIQAHKHREMSYMCNVLDLQEKLKAAIDQKDQLLSSVSFVDRKSMKTSPLNPKVNQYYQKDFQAVCDQLSNLIEQRIKSRQMQNIIQTIVSNYETFGGFQSKIGLDEGTSILSKQKNSLQQKSRILSREVSKLKSLIFKNAELSYNGKTSIIQLLKPCENITNELIKIIQNFTKQTDEDLQQIV